MVEVQTIRCPDCGHSFDFSNYVGEELLNCGVKLTKKTLQRTSWAELDGEIQDGRAAMVFDIGDSLSFELKNGKTASVEVAAINPYGRGVAFSFTDILWEKSMNRNNTNRGGWLGSDMSAFLDNEIISEFPDDLLAVIKAREIEQRHQGQTYKGASRLWLPSFTEVFGKQETYSDCDIGDVQFPLFEDRKNRIKLDESGVRYWWLRSPYVGNSAYFWSVYYNGSGNSYYGASNAYGVCPCFII